MDIMDVGGTKDGAAADMDAATDAPVAAEGAGGGEVKTLEERLEVERRLRMDCSSYLRWTRLRPREERLVVDWVG
jgi:hypothetical protein